MCISGMEGIWGAWVSGLCMMVCGGARLLGTLSFTRNQEAARPFAFPLFSSTPLSCPGSASPPVPSVPVQSFFSQRISDDILVSPSNIGSCCHGPFHSITSRHRRVHYITSPLHYKTVEIFSSNPIY